MIHLLTATPPSPQQTSHHIPPLSITYTDRTKTNRKQSKSDPPNPHPNIRVLDPYIEKKEPARGVSLRKPPALPRAASVPSSRLPASTPPQSIFILILPEAGDPSSKPGPRLGLISASAAIRICSVVGMHIGCDCERQYGVRVQVKCPFMFKKNDNNKETGRGTAEKPM
jgi:hypothetical protein